MFRKSSHKLKLDFVNPLITKAHLFRYTTVFTKYFFIIKFNYLTLKIHLDNNTKLVSHVSVYMCILYSMCGYKDINHHFTFE